MVLESFLNWGTLCRCGAMLGGVGFGKKNYYAGVGGVMVGCKFME